MQNPSKADRFLLPTFIGILILISLSLAIPDVRAFVRDRAWPDSREILGRVDGDLNGQGDLVSVIKVKTRLDLIVEVYSQQPQPNVPGLRARIVLPERKDGYFQFQGRPTNLAMMDLDGDGIQEILVPTFDDNLIPRLHVYRYDPQAQVFIPSGPDVLRDPHSPQQPEGH